MLAGGRMFLFDGDAVAVVHESSVSKMSERETQRAVQCILRTPGMSR